MIPIIYITAIYNEAYYRTQEMKSGAVDFIAKPIIPDLFIGKVTIFVNLYRQKTLLEQEIRRRKVMESELIKAKKIAEDAAMAKQQFLSTMSHEIRTPLNGIINIARLLIEDNPRREQMENLEILQFSAENLLQLINDILDFSKIDSGKIEFENISFDIRKQLEFTIKSLEYQAVKKGLTLEYHIERQVPNYVSGDSVRLSQILINLIGNAIKFTEKGKVTLDVSFNNDFAETFELLFKVADTGIGIPEDKQKTIFDSFTQASSSTTRKYGGTGLGLAITKKLVELQGGEIRLESREQMGSTFSFTLKLAKSTYVTSPEPLIPESHELSLKGLKILVVEDNLVNQKIVSKFLTKWEAIVEFAENGKTGVEKVLSADYDLILMDLHMPEMNGYEATQKIRESHDKKYREVPIIALTASAFSEDRERISQCGMNGYILKPFNPRDLYDTLLGYVKGT